MPDPEPCRPECVERGGRSFSTPVTTHARECPRCGATVWHFPEEHQSGTDVPIAATAMATARRGDGAGLLGPLEAAVVAGWWAKPREWALLVESIHPDLARWRAVLATSPALAPVRAGVEELADERAREAGVSVPETQFAARTEQLPPGVRRARYGRCDEARCDGDTLTLGMSGPTAADYGSLVRWRLAARPEVLRKGGRYHPLSWRFWSEETPLGVALLLVPPQGEVVVLGALGELDCHLVGRTLPEGPHEIRWCPRDTGAGGTDARRRGRTELRADDGTLLSSRDGPAVPAEPAVPAPRHPLDDGFARRVVRNGSCWARDGVVQYAPLDGADAWSERGGYATTGSDRLFVLTTFAGESPARYKIVDALSGERSAALELPRAPSLLTALAVAEGVLLTADARYAFVTLRSAAPAWASLPCAARVALGEAFGRRVVLTAIDEAERFLIVDVDRGVESEVRGVTPVRSGGFGPVFLADTWWGVVDTAPGGAAAGRAAP